MIVKLYPSPSQSPSPSQPDYKAIRVTLTMDPKVILYLIEVGAAFRRLGNNLFRLSLLVVVGFSI